MTVDNMPTSGTAVYTGSKLLDAQVGQETVMSAIVASVVGINVINAAFASIGP